MVLKTLSKLGGTEVNFLNLVMNIFKNPPADILFNSERLDIFPQDREQRENFFFHPTHPTPGLLHRETPDSIAGAGNIWNESGASCSFRNKGSTKIKIKILQWWR